MIHLDLVHTKPRAPDKALSGICGKFVSHTGTSYTRTSDNGASYNGQNVRYMKRPVYKTSFLWFQMQDMPCISDILSGIQGSSVTNVRYIYETRFWLFRIPEIRCTYGVLLCYIRSQIHKQSSENYQPLTQLSNLKII